MKINAKICPKQCKIGKRERQRLFINTQNNAVLVARSGRSTRYRKEILLHWHCPQCGFNMPVAMEDVRMESRYRATHK